LANEVGVSSHTIEEWISVLQASYLIVLLQPYFENFGKRVIKSPKIYFTDVGLLCYLLGIENIKQMSRDPLRGHLVENFVVMELFKARTNQGLEPQLYFYRDSQKNEVDVIFQRGHELIPIEIKSAKTFNQEFLKNLEFFQKITSGRSEQGFVIYCGEKEQALRSNRLINFKNSSISLQI
jgi:predicted AAA+ superfamily ATPase